MGAYSSRQVRSVRHEVHYRTPKKQTEIPGVTTEKYESLTGFIHMLPTGMTVKILQQLFLDEFGVAMRQNHHFAIVYCFGDIMPGKQMWNVLSSTDLPQLIENPDVRFVFSYIDKDPQLLES
jgi:hypothetical protein